MIQELGLLSSFGCIRVGNLSTWMMHHLAQILNFSVSEDLEFIDGVDSLFIYNALEATREHPRWVNAIRMAAASIEVIRVRQNCIHVKLWAPISA